MNCTSSALFSQAFIYKNTLEHKRSYLRVPCTLENFRNTATYVCDDEKHGTIYEFQGNLKKPKHNCKCPYCKCRMQIHDSCQVKLKHFPILKTYTCVTFEKLRYKCPKCDFTCMQNVPFQALGHNITTELKAYVIDLLEKGNITVKCLSELTGLCKNTIHDIDLERLREKHTVDGAKLKKPEKQARFLGIDEFKLHNGYKFATIIVDLETGHILWITEGKKKSCVYDFINFVGQKWMSGVKAVACDMNSDYQEAVQERCPHIKIVYDLFHIQKNFNDKVISEIRKDEQRRLIEAGDKAGAKALKNTKYILTSSIETLERKDREAAAGKILHKGSQLFKIHDLSRKAGYVEKYNELIKSNSLLFACALVKEKIRYAYSLNDEQKMEKEIIDTINICLGTRNKHFAWFAKLLFNHLDGIVSHAKYKISTGKVEGINNKIKTLRRQGYGYPNDEYFFLKLIDIC